MSLDFRSAIGGISWSFGRARAFVVTVALGIYWLFGWPYFRFWAPKIATGTTFVMMLLVPNWASQASPAYAIALAVVASSMVTLLVLRARVFSRASRLFGLCAQASLIILNFATIFTDFGLIRTASACGANLKDACFWDGLYFSIVTWTTLGYGDLTPPPQVRLIAATEALTGYVYFGLIVGIAAGIFARASGFSESSATPPPPAPQRG